MSDETYSFDIDQYALDREWVRQPALYHEAAIELSTAKANYEALKADKELVEAELDYSIRKEGEGAEKKPTEDAIKKAIIRSEKYQKVQSRLLKAKHRVDVCGVAVSTLEHRKKALEDLVNLRLADYFSAPRAPREGIRGEGTPKQRKKVNSDG